LDKSNIWAITNTEQEVSRVEVTRVLVGIPLLLFAVLSGATLWTAAPDSDEGWFGIPACLLVQEGRLINPVVEPVRARHFGIDQRQYWITPLHFLELAAAFRLGGCGLPVGRSVSVLWGMVSLTSAFFLLLSLTNDPRLAAFAASLLAVDPAFLEAAANMRPDIACFGAGLAALAAYRLLRTRSLRWAVTISHSLVALSVMIHPNGLVSFLALLLMTWQLDRQRLRLSLILFAAPPYLLAAAGWGIYIAQDPRLFLIQWTNSVIDANADNLYHKPLLGRPILSLIAEWKGRYVAYYGFTGDLSLSAAARSLPLIILLLGTILSSLRRERRTLLAVAVVYLLFFTFLRSGKRPYNLVYTVSFLELLAAVTWWSWISKPGRKRLAGLALLSVLIVCQFARTARRVRLDAYHKQFLPVASFLLEESTAQDSIVASREFFFALTGKRVFRDDVRLGTTTGRPARWIVLGEPAVPPANDEWAYFGKIQSGYREAFRNERYAVYVQR
jgi:hypothetical protein